MLRLGVILALIGVCLAASISIQGQRNTIITKRDQSLNNLKNVVIVGGNDTTIQKHPYQASLLVNGYFECAATIVSKNYVLTLADCVHGKATEDLQVRVGSNNTDEGGTLYNVKSIIVHPEYNRSSSSYDLGLVKLRKSIKFSKTVKKVGLPGKELKIGQKVVLSGWGDHYGTNGNPFQEVTVAGVDHSSCNDVYTPYNYSVDDSMVCATASGVGPCTNDFGDPIVTKNKLYGVFSWGLGCAVDGYPPVYASVAASLTWIKKCIKT